MAKYDNLMKKHVILEKELVTLRKNFEGRGRVDKDLIAYFKKYRDHNIII